MKQWKKWTSLLLAMGMTVGMAACTGGGGETSSGGGASSAPAESAKAENTGKAVEISLPTFKAGENVGAVFFLPQVERFNQKYEGKYKINIEEVPQASYAEKIKQLAQQKKLPVLMHTGVDNEWFKRVAIPNGMCYDLTEWYNSSEDAKKFGIQESVDYSTRDGKLVTTPLAVVRPMGLFYNSALYKPEKPIHEMTPDEFIASLGDNKIAMQTADNAWCSVLLLSDLIANEEGGAELLAAHTDEKIVDFNQPAIISAVAKLQKILQANASSNTIGAAYADAANNFMSGSSAVIFNGPWMSAEFNPDSSDKWSNDFDGANVRADLLPGNVGLANTRGFGEWWVSAWAAEEEIELAKAWLDFTLSQEELEAYMLAEGGSCPGMEYSENFLAKQKETQVLADLSGAINEKTVFTPALGDAIPTSVAETEIGKMLPKLADGSMTPEQFCQDLTAKAQAAVA